MKRFLVRLLALGILVAAGMIAIAQAQRGSQAGQAGVDEAPFDPFQGAEQAPPAAPPADPFAGVRRLQEPAPPSEREFNRDPYSDRDALPEPRRFPADDEPLPRVPRPEPERDASEESYARIQRMGHQADRYPAEPFPQNREAEDISRDELPEFDPRNERDSVPPRDPRAGSPALPYGDDEPPSRGGPGQYEPPTSEYQLPPSASQFRTADAGVRNEPEPRRDLTAPAEPAPFPSLNDPGLPDSRHLPPDAEPPLAGGAPALLGTGRPGERALEGAQLPSLQVQKLAPAEIQVGKPATFEILVRNVGKTTARQVQVRDSVPRGTEFIGASPPPQIAPQGELIWMLDVLNPGDERVLKVELMPLSEGEIGSVATVTFAAEASVRSLATRPELRVDVAAPTQVMIGGEVTLKIKVWNPGTGPATGVVLSEHVPPGFSHPGGGVLEYSVGDLKPGESRELELTLVATKAGQIVNLINARADGALRAEGRTQIEVVSPALEVVLQGPKKRFLERQATYTIEISNPGTADATNVDLITYVPKGFKFVNADNYGAYDSKTGSVSWSLERLPPNERGVVTLNLLPVESGVHTLAVEGKAQHDLKARSEHEVQVEGVSAILFQVRDKADPVEVGAETAYEIQIVNQGSKVATDVELVVTLPPELKPLATDGPSRGVIQGNQIVFDRLDRLAPRAETTYRVRVRGERPGDLRTQVQLKTAEMTTPVTKEESTHVYIDQ